MPKLRVVDPSIGHPRDLARRLVSERRPFRWRITPEEFAVVQAATIREQRVNWELVAQSNRRKRWS